MYAPLIITEICKTPKTNDKIAIIQKHKDNKEFLELLGAAFNPYYVYGLKKIETILTVEDILNNETGKINPYEDLEGVKVFGVPINMTQKPVQKNQHEGFLNLLEYLKNASTNKQQRETVSEFLSTCDVHSQRIYSDIICKSLKIGVQVTSINKALGYDLIPSFNCMLAQPNDEKTVFKYPLIVQPKLDGVRCIIIKNNKNISAFTRQGKTLFLPHIFQEWAKVEGNFVLDGELLHSKNRLKTSGICNKIIKGSPPVEELQSLNFHAFDLLSFDEFKALKCTNTAKYRLLDLEKVFLTQSFKYSVQITTFVVDDYDGLVSIYKFFRKDGGEGVIAKDSDGLYEYKRSKNWVKFKAIKSATLKVTGFVEGEGKYVGLVGALTCESSCGKLKVNIGSGLTDEDRCTFIKRMPEFIEVEFNELQEDKEENWFMFLPRFKEVRIDKDVADSLQTILAETAEVF